MALSPPIALTYFNLHTSGIGYLNRVRDVPVRRGNAFLACEIAALHGAADAVVYTRIDCNVVGKDAEQLIRGCMAAVQAEHKVLLSFRIGDLWVDPFLYQKGERAGQPGASLKGRLLFIHWIKIDGALVYQAEAKPEAVPPQAPQTPSDPAVTAHTT